jgi:hypothetical protein
LKRPPSQALLGSNPGADELNSRRARITLVLTVLGSVDIWLVAGFGGIVAL